MFLEHPSRHGQQGAAGGGGSRLEIPIGDSSISSRNKKAANPEVAIAIL